ALFGGRELAVARRAGLACVPRGALERLRQRQALEQLHLRRDDPQLLLEQVRDLDGADRVEAELAQRRVGGDLRRGAVEDRGELPAQIVRKLGVAARRRVVMRRRCVRTLPARQLAPAAVEKAARAGV